MKYTKRIRKVITQQRAKVIFGLDPSLKGFGLSVFVDGELHGYQGWTDKKGLQKTNNHTLSYFKLSGATESNKLNRADIIFEWLKHHVNKFRNTTIDSRQVDLYVAIEGYAFSGNDSRGASDTHELCGVIKHWLFKRNIPIRIYDPLSVKLAWAGKGNATKEDMINVVERRFNLILDDEDTAAENIADSVLIGALLHLELEVKAGEQLLKDLDESFRRVLLRVTKAEPEALISRDMLHAKHVKAIKPILARERKNGNRSKST